VRQSRAHRGSIAPSSIGNRGAHAPVVPRRERVGVGRCGFEAGRVADGAGHTWPAPRRGPDGPAEHAPREGGRRSPEALLTCSEKIGIPAVLATSAMICARDGQRSGSQKLSPLN
jgi:hypothetical protein